jgi:hypothetical protein
MKKAEGRMKKGNQSIRGKGSPQSTVHSLPNAEREAGGARGGGGGRRSDVRGRNEVFRWTREGMSIRRRPAMARQAVQCLKSSERGARSAERGISVGSGFSELFGAIRRFSELFGGFRSHIFLPQRRRVQTRSAETGRVLRELRKFARICGTEGRKRLNSCKFVKFA